MKVSKKEILDVLKKNNLNEEQAEQVLEMISKGLGNSIIDIVKLLIDKLENDTAKMVASMIYMALEGKAKEAVKDIEVSL